MILDIACGSNPHGDVNLDVGPYVLASDSGPLTKANIYGSVYNLPFKDDSFSVVHFVGLLHHLDNPEMAWKEIVRVSKDVIIGEEPSILNPLAHMDKYHVYHGFTPSHIQSICKIGIPHLRINLMMPILFKPWHLTYCILAMKRHQLEKDR